MARDERDRISTRIFPMTKGINRFSGDATRDQTIDALDVVNDRGDLRRRDAYVPVGSAPPHLLPAGLAVVRVWDRVAEFPVSVPSRAIDLTGAAHGILPLQEIYIGNTRAAADPLCWGGFSGIDVRYVEAAGVMPDSHLQFVPQYHDGGVSFDANWHDFPGWMDETLQLWNGIFVPFTRDGRIYWHTSQLISTWFATNWGAGSGWWVRLQLRETVTGDRVSFPAAATAEVQAPGLRLFNLAPVNGLVSARVRGRRALVAGSDRVDRRLTATGIRNEDLGLGFASGMEHGSQLGARVESGETKTLYLLEDEGAAVYGTQAWPQNQRNGVLVGAPGLTYGTANRLQKTRQQFFDAANIRFVPYVWPPGRWRGGRLTNDMQRVVGSTATELRVAPSATNGIRPTSGFYRGCRLVVTTAAGGGPALDEEVEIFDHVYNGVNHFFYLNGALSAAPVAGDRFRAYGPPPVVFFANQRRVYEARNNAAHTIEIASGKNYTPSPSSISPTKVHFRAGRELRWVADAGQTWSFVVDLVTGNLLGTNGKTGILEYDGYSVRTLKADFLGPQALRIAGDLPDELKQGQSDPKSIALTVLRKEPPRGKYLAVHRNRIFVSGFDAEPYTVKWSSVGGANNVWPLVCEGLVRDAEEDAVTGMFSLGDRLIVTTPTAVHEAIDIDAPPFFDFIPLARGIGCVGPNAACSLIGTDSVERLFFVAPDGLYTLAAGEPSIVLDDWARVLAGGVNVAQVHRAIAVALPQKSVVAIAIAQAGSSRNNRLIWYDKVREAFWLWSLPFGCSSLAVDTDQSGRERLLIGTDDGYIMTLAAAKNDGGNSSGHDDDGDSINGYAVTPPQQAPGGYEVELDAALLSLLTQSARGSHRMSVDILLGDDLEQAVQESLITVDRGAPFYEDADLAGFEWSTGLDPGDGDPIPDHIRWTKSSFKTVRLSIANGVRAHRYSLRISGSCQWAFKGGDVLLRPLQRRGR